MVESSKKIPSPPSVRPLKTKTRAGRHHRIASVRARRHRSVVRQEVSAGGVAVRLERGSWFVALLKIEHKRGEVWVLPKGHVEEAKNENFSEAARREVTEEAGLQDVSVRDQLGVTRYVFQAEEGLVRKTVHYFLMETGQKRLVPQAEEGFIDAAWFPLDVAITMLEYDTDQDIVARAREKLTGKSIPETHSSGKRVRLHM